MPKRLRRTGKTGDSPGAKKSNGSPAGDSLMVAGFQDYFLWLGYMEIIKASDRNHADDLCGVMDRPMISNQNRAS